MKEDANDRYLKDIIENDDLFSILDQIPRIGQTKVFHVLILLAFYKMVHVLNCNRKIVNTVNKNVPEVLIYSLLGWRVG